MVPLSTSGCDRGLTQPESSSAYSHQSHIDGGYAQFFAPLSSVFRLRHFSDGHLGMCSIAFRLLPGGVLSRKAARVVLVTKDLI
jgi:hypothetical protein